MNLEKQRENFKNHIASRIMEILRFWILRSRKVRIIEYDFFLKKTIADYIFLEI